MSAQVSLATANQFTPIEFLAAGARLYGRTVGTVAPRIDFKSVRLDPVLGRRISDAYMAAPLWDGRALVAYEAFRVETIQQFRFLTGSLCGGGLAVTVEVVDYDPYDTAKAMAEDLKRHRLKVYSSNACGNPHPFLSNWENDMFRAVHDAFGHAASGCGFDRDGEEAAWLKHCFMYSKLARRALTTETRGQSCAHFYHYEGKQFAKQKLALLPERFNDPGLPS